ncbi:hypothetical protein [Microbacterium sp. PMB16]|uniref:hypothetical protein n=1 Tax=Microbacterium sp. PMB16 TaxID=3120157 RepID=UPI003F4BA08A
MDDKNLTPDQTPDHSADAPTVPVTPTDAAPQAAATEQHAAAPAAAAPAAPVESKPRRTRALLIGGGIAAAVVLVGGGIAVGAAIADDLGDDDHPSVSDGPRHDADDRQDDRGDRDDQRDDDAGPPANGQGPAAAIGADSADELITIADAARGAADGEVTSIDAKRDGAWEVQLTTAAGAETEVRVDDKLSATVISSEPAEADDTAPTLTLDDDAIRSLVSAALAEADGMITDLDVDSDDVSPYDASVLTSDNRSIDIDFSAEFAVVGTDIDD